MALPKLEPLDDDDASCLSNGFLVDANQSPVHNEDQTYSDDEEEQDPNIFAGSQQGNMPELVNRTSTDIKRSNSPAAKEEDAFIELPPESKLARVKSEEPAYDLDMPNPTQRLRQILDGIFLPSLSEVRKRKAEEAAVDLEKVMLLKDPKIKKNLRALLPSTLRDRLQPIGLDIQDQYFTIDQITRESLINRLFMAQTYGGNMQATFPRPRKELLDRHGMNDFMYLPADKQPEAPQLPGAPGLWFSTESAEDFSQIQRVFAEYVPVGGARSGVKYQYKGQYEFRAANPPSLTAQEWSVQSPQFHNEWAHAILSKEWGQEVCARVVFRRELKEEPSAAEIEYAIQNKWHLAVTTEEIKEAYFQGKERLGVWTMKCVGYDNKFQQELHDVFPTWIPPPRKPRKKAESTTKAEPKKKAAPKAQAATRTPANRRVPKRKRKRNDNSTFDTDTDSESEVIIVEDEPSDIDEDTPKVKRRKRDSDIIELSDDDEP